MAINLKLVSDQWLGSQVAETEMLFGAQPAYAASLAAFIWPWSNPAAPASIKGTNKADALNGTADDEDITAKGGDDTVQAGAGNDIIHGNEGQDTIYGEDGDDEIYGDWGDDKLLSGGAGNDVIDGGWGADNIEGGSGDDTIEGGWNNDTINAGAGVNTMKGGWGNDTFVFDQTCDDVNTILKFQGEDKDVIDLSALGIPGAINAGNFQTNFMDAMVDQVGNDVNIHLGGNALIVLNNFSMANLDYTDFIFA
ncbi:MAG: hypothetical protein LBE78_10185 [Burkholderiaceae bacterium]|jgi:Ca2+-binding RTX toxin-like protein|nr:hypothetical protein [Burkholderiaceae bacterium]